MLARVCLQDRTDGILEVQLFMRQALSHSFRTYTIIAENGVAIKRQTVSLVNSEYSFYVG